MQYKHIPWQLLLIGTAIFSSASQAEWKYNTELFFAASDDASAGGMRWLQPWWQNGKAMAFSDLRFMQTDKSTEEINLGGGYRRLNEDETAILGGYGFFDYRYSATNKEFPQITLGAEYLLDKWEFRSNAYIPLKDEHVIRTLPDRKNVIEENFIGHFVNRVTSTIPGGKEIEEAMMGFDIEAGYLLPGAEDFELRANLALYSFSAPVAGDATGLRARIEAFPRQNFRVSFSIESDELFDTRSFLEFTLPLGRRLGHPGQRSLHQRMTQFAHRDIDVRETSRLDAKQRIKNGPGSAYAKAHTTRDTNRPERGIAHIDSSRANDDPDGSIEKPYASIQECIDGAGSGKAIHCGSGNDDTRTIYLHANNSSTVNGNTQHYIGNLTLTKTQKLVGDGTKLRNFRNLSTGVTPILLGAESNGDETPIVTMHDRTRLSGLQLGWSFTETTGDDDTVRRKELPAGSIMPSTAVLVQDARGASISDLTLTGFLLQPGVSGTFNTDSNFETGIHSISTGAEDDTVTLIRNAKINAVLGDAVYSQIKLSDHEYVEQSLALRDVEISKSGRGVHTSVESTVDNSFARQYLSIASDNLSSTRITNSIKLNFNEGVLMENMNTLTGNGAADFAAVQNLRVQNTQIEGNQGAGIQTLFGPTGRNSDNEARTSRVKLERTTITRNDGSGLVLGSTSAKVEAELINTLFSANLEVERSGGNSFGQRLDLSSIDCASSAASDSDPSCGTPDTNGSSNRTDSAFRVTNYGIYARNRDASGAPGTQNISIKENFTSTLHAKDAAQIFLDSSDMQDSRSLQTINLRPADKEPANTDDKDSTTLVRGLDTRAGVSSIVNGSVVTGVQRGARSPAIAFCDNIEGESDTSTDGNSPHIAPFEGDLKDLPRIERNCP